MDDNSLKELQDLIRKIEESIKKRNELREEFESLSNSSSSNISIDEQLKRKKRISDLKEIIAYFEESFPENIKMAYKQLNQLKDSFLENYDESLELANYNKSIKEKEKEITSIRIRRSGLEKRMAKLQSDSEGRTEEEIRHLLDLGENTSKQLKEKLQSLYTEVEYMKNNRNNRNNINSVIFPKEILDLEESLEKYCLLLDIDKDSMIELSVQGNDDPAREPAGQTPPMPKEEDDPNPDNYKDKPEYSSLMEGIETLRKNINEAKNYFLAHFEDLDIASADDLNTFESLYLKQINEVNISACETFLEIINNPELYEESGFNKLLTDADELNEMFEEVKKSVQSKEQAGQTPPPEEENNDKDFESKLHTYESYLSQIKEKASSICSNYNFDVQDDFETLNASGSYTTVFEPLMNLSFKAYGKDVFLYGQPIDRLQDLYIDFPDPNEVASSYLFSPDDIDDYIDDCKLIIDALDRVEQDLKRQEEVGKGGKDDDDQKPGLSANIYNQILNRLAALENLINDTEKNIDYYDSTSKNSQTLLSLQSKYNNIDQTLLDNKTTIPEHLYKSLKSRLNDCHKKIDDIQRNIDNPPPKPVESKKEKITDISYQDPSIIDETSNYVVTLKDGTQLDLEKFKEIVSGVVELIVYGPKTYNYIDTLKSLKFNISEKTLSYDEFYNYITNVITMLPTFPKELNSEKDLYIVEKIEDIKDLFFNHIDRHTESFGYMNLNAIYSQLRRLEQRISYNPPISLDELHNINIEKKQLIEKANNILQKTENKYLKMGKAKRTDISNTITRLEQIYTEIQEAIEKAKIERKEAKKELKKDKNQRLDYKELSKAYKKMLKAEKKGDTSELDFFNECLNQAKSYDKNTKNILFTDIYNKMQASINVLNRIEANPSLFEKEIKAKKENGIVKKAKQFATSVKNALGNIKALSSGKDNDDDYIDIPNEDIEKIDFKKVKFDVPSYRNVSFRRGKAENAEAARAEAGKPHAEPFPIDVHAEPVTGDDVKKPGGSGGSGDHR